MLKDARQFGHWSGSPERASLLGTFSRDRHEWQAMMTGMSMSSLQAFPGPSFMVYIMHRGCQTRKKDATGWKAKTCVVIPRGVSANDIALPTKLRWQGPEKVWGRFDRHPQQSSVLGRQ
jgi:hypothetical protein